MTPIFCPIITSKDIGGGIKSTIALLNGLQTLGHTVTVLVPMDCEFITSFSSGVNVIYFDKKPTISIVRFYSFLQLCKYTKKVFDQINEKHDTLYFCSDRPALMLAFLLSKKTPLFYVSRGWFYKNLSARFLRFFMFPRVQQFVGISDKQYKLMKLYAPKKAKVNLIENGIEIPKQNFTTFQDKVIKLATIGGICDRKNQMQCIKLINILKDSFSIHLNIFGTTFTAIDEAYKKTLEAYIEKHKLQNWVTFKGNETSFDVMYSQVDIVLSTAKEEGFGRTLIEAMSYGIPVIANDKAGGPSMIISHGLNGLLYDSSLEDLKSKTEFMILNDSHRGQMITNALSLVKEKYTMKRVVEDYSQLIENTF